MITELDSLLMLYALACERGTVQEAQPISQKKSVPDATMAGGQKQESK